MTRIDPELVRTIGLVACLAAGLLALVILFGQPWDALSESEAITIAQRDARSSSITPPHFVLARLGRLSEFRDGASDAAAPPNRWVWAVVFTGRYPLTGGPPPGRNVFAHSRLVVIDYRSGKFVMAEEPSPIPLGIRLGG